jgi:glutaredoxin
MDIKIYTLTGCHYCVKIKELLKRSNLEYTEQLLDRDFTREEFKQKFPSATGYPIMTIDEQYIGGVTEAVKYFVEKGLVSSKRS